MERGAPAGGADAAPLLELLTDGFGEIAAEIEAGVRAAGSDEIRAWSKKLLRASTLEDVFVIPPR